MYLRWKTCSFNRTKTTRYGHDLNVGTVQLDDVYSLKTAGDRFEVTFDQFGHHRVEMSGSIEDPWGNTYAGGGTYDLWVAYPLDIDPGLLPGTPLTLNAAINPALQLYPRVPAEVTLKVSHYPDSNPNFMEVYTVTGQANNYGYFSSSESAIEYSGKKAKALYIDLNGNGRLDAGERMEPLAKNEVGKLYYFKRDRKFFLTPDFEMTASARFPPTGATSNW